MQKNKSEKLHPAENKPQVAAKRHTGEKHHPPVKTPATDTIRNTASQSIGLNESKTEREDLLPPD